MKKILYPVSTLVGALSILVGHAYAELPPPTGVPGLTPPNGTGSAGIIAAIVKILTVVLDLITILGVVFVVVAGVRLIISGGDEGEKDKAKKTIIYVIVGIVVVLFARVIVTFFASIA